MTEAQNGVFIGKGEGQRCVDVHIERGENAKSREAHPIRENAQGNQGVVPAEGHDARLQKKLKINTKGRHHF